MKTAISIGGFREKLRLLLPNGWELIIVLAAVFYLLPHTLLSRPPEVPFLSFLYTLGIVDEGGSCSRSASGLVYLAGYVLLLCLLLKYLYVRAVKQDLALPTIRFADAVCLFSGLYLLDFFTSTTHPLPFHSCWWAFFVFSTFFVVVLFFDSRMALRLTKLLVIAIGIQSLYAIIYYVLDINQFMTPEFGKRTGGTFEGFGRTNTFYPLCLLGIPLSLSLAEVQLSAWWRWTFRAASGVILLALVFTYSRSGWLALIPAFLYLAFSLYSPLHVSHLWRVLMVTLAVVLLLGTMFVRTKGKMIGHPDDRSFWGRVAIWQVAGRTVAHRPWLGSGLSSYREEQYEHLTPQLKQFNPLNVEAKCFYLNIAAEFGVVGLALFSLMAWRYASLYRSTAHSLPASEVRAAGVGIHAGVLALAVAGLTDTPILQFDRQPSSFAFAALLGVLCALVNEVQPLAPHSPQPPKESRNAPTKGK